MLAITLVLGALWGVVAGQIAVGKRRDGVAWFCVGFTLGLIGVLIAWRVSPIPEPERGYANGPVPEPARSPNPPVYANWPPR
jgi:hypothetical protein